GGVQGVADHRVVEIDGPVLAPDVAAALGGAGAEVHAAARAAGFAGLGVAGVDQIVAGARGVAAIGHVAVAAPAPGDACGAGTETRRAHLAAFRAVGLHAVGRGHAHALAHLEHVAAAAPDAIDALRREPFEIPALSTLEAARHGEREDGEERSAAQHSRTVLVRREEGVFGVRVPARRPEVSVDELPVVEARDLRANDAERLRAPRPGEARIHRAEVRQPDRVGGAGCDD